jgi:hypothetical protein
VLTGCKSPHTDNQGYWTKTFGGPDDDCGWSVQQTSDSGYIIAGTKAYGTANSDAWLIKTDADGNEVWDKTFGGTGSYDCGYSVQQTTDGGYVMAASIYSGGSYVLLIKTDADGNEIWDLAFREHHFGHSVQQTFDGGYIIAGDVYPETAYDCNVFLLKTDASGNKVWEKSFGASNWREYCYSAQQTSDSGYIVVSSTFYASSPEVWLIKTDANGNVIWERCYGWEGQDDGSSVQQTSDGGYIVAGNTYSRGAGQSDVLLVKIDAGGNKVWDKTFGGRDWDYGESVRQTSDGGYVIAGIKSDGTDNSDAWLIKTDADGNQVWDKTFGGEEGDKGYSVQQTFDGEYVVVGYTRTSGAASRDVMLVKTETSGDSVP